MSTVAIVLIIIGVLVVIALVAAAARRRAREREVDERRQVAGAHREEASSRRLTADEQAARARRQAAEAEESARVADRERETASTHEEHADRLDPDAERGACRVAALPTRPRYRKLVAVHHLAARRGSASLDREVEIIVRALEEHGPTQRRELAPLTGARYWGPGRFNLALREAVGDGAVRRTGRNAYELAREREPGAAEGSGEQPL